MCHSNPNFIKKGPDFSSSVKWLSFHPGYTGYSRKYINKILYQQHEKFRESDKAQVRPSNENTLLKQYVERLKTGPDFQNKRFEEEKRDLDQMRARNPLEENIKLIEQKQQLEEKNSELEDKSRQNNQAEM